jgi:hypothetical protein
LDQTKKVLLLKHGKKGLILVTIVFLMLDNIKKFRMILRTGALKSGLNIFVILNELSTSLKLAIFFVFDSKIIFLRFQI